MLELVDTGLSYKGLNQYVSDKSETNTNCKMANAHYINKNKCTNTFSIDKGMILPLQIKHLE